MKTLSHTLLLLVILVTSGCSGPQGPQVAPVSGKVTLDGQPLSGALVTFYPQDGRPSMGTTDSSGSYSLNYTRDQPGAILGNHTVRITTGLTSGEETQKVKETVPAKFNSQSELTASVAKDSNTLNFDLKK